MNGTLAGRVGLLWGALWLCACPHANPGPEDNETLCNTDDDCSAGNLCIDHACQPGTAGGSSHGSVLPSSGHPSSSSGGVLSSGIASSTGVSSGSGTPSGMGGSSTGSSTGASSAGSASSSGAGTSSSEGAKACAGVRGTRFGLCGQIGVDLPPVSGARFGLDGELILVPPSPSTGTRFGLVGEVVVHGP